jgi:Kef-type K+ transport system membrane component KefB
MSSYVILIFCVLILLAYLFDITSRYTRIPGVVFLIGLGIGIQVLVETTGFSIPDFNPLLPVFGTIGLMLIIMEASLDLKLAKNKFRLIIKSATAAVFLFALFVGIMTIILVYSMGYMMV